MAILSKAIGKTSPQNSTNFVGAPSFRYVNPAFYNHYKSEEYASAYPNVRAIADEYITVLPVAKNVNGEVVDSPIIDALFHPNQSDDIVSFNEKIITSTLTHRKTYILVWRKENGRAEPGGNFGFRGSNIAGFTFLECPGISRRDGKTYYNIGSQEFTEDEVMVLPGGVDPNDLQGGYSPTESAIRWITLDDYIADYQSGFFENGAVPAGQFIITAATDKEYNNMVDMLQKKHRGAGKNNNVTYSHRPIDQMSGKPVEAQIEWVPFAQSNKDIDFKSVFEQANKRIDLAYGVSQIIKGVDDQAKYSNADVSERGFAKRAVYPRLLRNYTRITHELNRITGGIGVAITFEYDIPEIADKKKVEAQTHRVNVETIGQLEKMGYTLGSIVDAFHFPDDYKLLKKGTESPTIIEDDKPEVDEGDEVKESPDPERIDGVTPVNKVKNELTQSDVDSYEQQLSFVIRDNMEKQIADAISELDANNATDDEDQEAEDFTEEMMVVIVSTLIAAGTIQYDEGLSMLVAAGISIDDTTTFTLSEAQRLSYRDYLVNVARSYRDDTAQSIRNVLSRANTEGWDRNTLESALHNIMNTDQWRVSRLARSEINRSQDMGSINSMKQIQDEADVSFERALLHTGSDEPCEFCRAYIDNWMLLDDPMIDKNELITGVDGGQLVYTWDINEGHDVHANGHCVPQYRVVQR